MKDILDLLGRIIIGSVFIFEAIESIIYFDSTIDTMIEKGITWHPNFFLVFSIFLLIVGGAMILFGYRVLIGGTLLLIYWVPIVVIQHDWWNETEPLRRLELLIFLRSMGMVGGVLHIMAHGSGRYSVRRLLASSKVPKRFR